LRTTSVIDSPGVAGRLVVAREPLQRSLNAQQAGVPRNRLDLELSIAVFSAINQPSIVEEDGHNELGIRDHPWGRSYVKRIPAL
jgi:hypothetical protein